MKLAFLLSLLLVGCTSVNRTALYKWHSGIPWRIHVVDQATVSEKCSELMALGAIVQGCTNPATAEIWMVDSAVVAQHECAHLRNFDERGELWPEVIKDFTLGWLDSLAFLTFGWLPADEKPCGDDYVYGSDSSSKWTKLPNVK